MDTLVNDHYIITKLYVITTLSSKSTRFDIFVWVYIIYVYIAIVKWKMNAWGWMEVLLVYFVDISWTILLFYLSTNLVNVISILICIKQCFLNWKITKTSSRQYYFNFYHYITFEWKHKMLINCCWTYITSTKCRIILYI